MANGCMRVPSFDPCQLAWQVKQFIRHGQAVLAARFATLPARKHGQVQAGHLAPVTGQAGSTHAGAASTAEFSASGVVSVDDLWSL